MIFVRRRRSWAALSFTACCCPAQVLAGHEPKPVCRSLRMPTAPGDRAAGVDTGGTPGTAAHVKPGHAASAATTTTGTDGEGERGYADRPAPFTASDLAFQDACFLVLISGVGLRIAGAGLARSGLCSAARRLLDDHGTDRSVVDRHATRLHQADPLRRPGGPAPRGGSCAPGSRPPSTAESSG
jgi:hypothetical protein